MPPKMEKVKIRTKDGLPVLEAFCPSLNDYIDGADSKACEKFTKGASVEMEVQVSEKEIETLRKLDETRKALDKLLEQEIKRRSV